MDSSPLNEQLPLQLIAPPSLVMQLTCLQNSHPFHYVCLSITDIQCMSSDWALPTLLEGLQAELLVPPVAQHLQ